MLEEYSIYGGLGSVVVEIFVEEKLVLMFWIGVKDWNLESGVNEVFF